jgi:hypothetical protein
MARIPSLAELQRLVVDLTSVPPSQREQKDPLATATGTLVALIWYCENQNLSLQEVATTACENIWDRSSQGRNLNLPQQVWAESFFLNSTASEEPDPEPREVDPLVFSNVLPEHRELVRDLATVMIHLRMLESEVSQLHSSEYHGLLLAARDRSKVDSFKSVLVQRYKSQLHQVRRRIVMHLRAFDMALESFSSRH